MAHAGARVILTSRSVEPGQKTAQELQTSGVKVSFANPVPQPNPCDHPASSLCPSHVASIPHTCLYNASLMPSMPNLPVCPLTSSPPVKHEHSYWSVIVTAQPIHPQGAVEVAQLDLADLSSVHQLAKQLNDGPALDFLFLNAGVMACPQSYTKNGFEMQVGTNHFGHFELTRCLMDKLKQQVRFAFNYLVTSQAVHQ